MSAYKCRDCGLTSRHFSAEEADLINSAAEGWCRSCAQTALRGQVTIILDAIDALRRESDDYMGRLRDDALEAQINALADVAKQLTADEPTERLGTLDDLIDRLADLATRSAS